MGLGASISRPPASYLMLGFAAFALAAPAFAICPSSRAFYSAAYIFTPGACDGGIPCGSDIGSSISSSLAGSFWRIGYGDPRVGQGADNGSLSALDAVDPWIATYPEYPAGLSGDWTRSFKIDGCFTAPPPPQCMAVALSDQLEGVGYFTLLSTDPNARAEFEFHPLDGDRFVLGEIPRPVVTGGTRGDAPGELRVRLRNAAVPTSALHLASVNCARPMILGYRVYRQRRAPLDPPPVDRRLANWELAPGGAGPQGEPIPLDAETVVDVNTCGSTDLALTLVFESGFETQHVSRSVVIDVDAYCSDDDCDGWPGFCEAPEVPLDCDDADPSVYPGAPQLCDGRNNDCNAPDWPAVPADESDADGDGHRPCSGDCDEASAVVYPGAPPICDGLNNDCTDPLWPAPPAAEVDGDGDGVSGCAGDCDDAHAAVHSGAPEVCDGLANDCSAPGWPVVPPADADLDGDGVAACAGDCADADPARHPGAAEACNGLDDDCDGVVDEDPSGPDSDGDGSPNSCDNCPAHFNPAQLDTDGDGRGNACDNCIATANADQADTDGDLRGDACDNCPDTANTGQENADGDVFGDACDNCPDTVSANPTDLDSDAVGDTCDNCVETYNPLQDDTDTDRDGDACDNCLFDFNPNQTDGDDDFEGDACDLDDGAIYLRFAEPELVEWHEESGYELWNLYRGDLAVLRTSGVYTQASGDLAGRECGLVVPWAADSNTPAPGQVAFFLVSGTHNGVEGSLGADSDGNERANTLPCP